MDCETCQRIFYDEQSEDWIIDIESNNWNDYIDSFDYTQLHISYCPECGTKLGEK